MGTTPARKASTIPLVATGLLWLLAAALGLVATYSIYQLSPLAYMALGGKDGRTSYLIAVISMVIAGLGWIAAVVLTGEYLLKHAGERKAWRILAWMLGVEILFIALNLIITRSF